jgi:hypothetical protein
MDSMRFFALFLLFLLTLSAPARSSGSPPSDANRQVLAHLAQARKDIESQQYPQAKKELKQAQSKFDVFKSHLPDGFSKNNSSLIQTQASIKYALYALEVNRPEVAEEDIQDAGDSLHFATGTG